MSQKNYKGLCSTCDNAETCMYLKNYNGIVWQCEEYTDRAFVKSNPHGKKEVKEASETGTDKRSTGNDDMRVYKGLCVNCNHRKECDKEMVEGGIWHCENYE